MQQSIPHKILMVLVKSIWLIEKNSLFLNIYKLDQLILAILSRMLNQYYKIWRKINELYSNAFKYYNAILKFVIIKKFKYLFFP